jgi:predicted CoA-binding protein
MIVITYGSLYSVDRSIDLIDLFRRNTNALKPLDTHTPNVFSALENIKVYILA